MTRWHITPTGQIRPCHYGEGREGNGAGDSSSVTEERYSAYQCDLDRTEALSLLKEQRSLGTLARRREAQL